MKEFEWVYGKFSKKLKATSERDRNNFQRPRPGRNGFFCLPFPLPGKWILMAMPHFVILENSSISISESQRNMLECSIKRKWCKAVENVSSSFGTALPNQISRLAHALKFITWLEEKLSYRYRYYVVLLTNSCSLLKPKKRLRYFAQILLASLRKVEVTRDHFN